MNIGGTLVNHQFVNGDGWVNLEAWTGRSLRTIPLAFREPDEGMTHVSSLMPQINDPCCDPRSGGIACIKQMARYYGVKPQQFKRHILPTLDFVRWFGNIPVSNVNSLQEGGLNYQQRVRDKNCANLKQYS